MRSPFISEKTKGREMLFHDVIFAVVVFILCPSGNCVTQNWVKQWPDEVHRSPGENITIHCQFHTDVQETVSSCLVQWCIMDRDGKYPSVSELSQFSGRHCIDRNESHWRSSLTLNFLEMNDTGIFHCNYICRVDGIFRQHNGNGTQLFVLYGFDKENATLQHPPFATTIIDGVKGQPRVYMLYPFLVSIVLFSKCVVFIYMTSVAHFSSY